MPSTIDSKGKVNTVVDNIEDSFQDQTSDITKTKKILPTLVKEGVSGSIDVRDIKKSASESIEPTYNHAILKNESEFEKFINFTIENNPKAHISLISSIEDFSQGNLSKETRVDENGNIFNMPGKLINQDNTQKKILLIDFRNMSDSDRLALNDLYVNPPKYGRNILGPNVQIISIIDKDITKGINNKNKEQDFWRRVSRGDLISRGNYEKSKLGFDFFNEKLTQNQNDQDSITIDFLGKNWEHELFGRLEFDNNQKLCFSPSKLVNLKEGQSITLLNAPWNDINFKIKLRSLMETGSYSVNGVTQALPEKIFWNRKDSDGEYLKNLKNDFNLVKANKQQNLDHYGNLAFINKHSFRHCFAPSGIDFDGNICKQDTFAKLLRDADALVITSELSETQWQIMLDKLQALGKSGFTIIQTSCQNNHPKIWRADKFMTPATGEQMNITKDDSECEYSIKVEKKITSITNEVKDTSSLIIPVAVDSTLNRLCTNINFSNTSYDKFEVIKKNFLLALEEGKHITILGLETNTKLAYELETLLQNPPALVINGVIHQFSKAKVTVILPPNATIESSIWASKYNEVEDTTLVVSLEELKLFVKNSYNYGNEHLDLINDMVDKQYSLVNHWNEVIAEYTQYEPIIYDKEFIIKSWDQVKLAQDLNKNKILSNDNLRQAMNLILHQYKDNKELHARLKLITRNYFAHINKPYIDFTSISKWVSSQDDIIEQTVKDNFWQLMKFMPNFNFLDGQNSLSVTEVKQADLNSTTKVQEENATKVKEEDATEITTKKSSIPSTKKTFFEKLIGAIVSAFKIIVQIIFSPLIILAKIATYCFYLLFPSKKEKLTDNPVNLIADSASSNDSVIEPKSVDSTENNPVNLIADSASSNNSVIEPKSVDSTENNPEIYNPESLKLLKIAILKSSPESRRYSIKTALGIDDSDVEQTEKLFSSWIDVDNNIKSYLRALLYLPRSEKVDDTNENISDYNAKCLEVAVNITKIKKSSISINDKKTEIFKILENILSKEILNLETVDKIIDPILYDTSWDNVWWNKHKEILKSRIKAHKICILYGMPGSGKSYIVEEIARELNPEQEPFILNASPEMTTKDLFGKNEEVFAGDSNKTEVKFVDGKLLKWAKSDSKNPVVLQIDEINLLDKELLNNISTIASDNPSTYLDGERIELSGNQRLVGTGNPESFSGRKLNKRLKSLGITIYCKPLPENTVRKLVVETELHKIFANENLLKKYNRSEVISEISSRIFTVYNNYRTILAKHEFTPRDLLECCSIIDTYLQQTQIPVEKITMEMLDAVILEAVKYSIAKVIPEKDKWKLEVIKYSYDATYNKNSKCNDAIVLDVKGQFNTFFDSMVSHYRVLDESTADNYKKDTEKKERFSFNNESTKKFTEDIWLVLIRLLQEKKSGIPHRGRRALEIEGPAGRGKDKLLQLLLNYFHKYYDKDKPMSNISINAGIKVWSDIKQTALEASKNGTMLTIPEANLMPSSVFEGAFNDLLTSKTVAPGFQVFTTVNPESYSGRSKKSTALKSRFTKIELDEYNYQDLLNIATHTTFNAVTAKIITDIHFSLKNYLEQCKLPQAPTVDDLKKLALEVKNSKLENVEDIVKVANKSYKFYLDILGELDSPVNIEEIFAQYSESNNSKDSGNKLQLNKWLIDNYTSNSKQAIFIDYGMRDIYDYKNNKIHLNSIHKNKTNEEQKQIIFKTLANCLWESYDAPIECPVKNNIYAKAVYKVWQQRFISRINFKDSSFLSKNTEIIKLTSEEQEKLDSLDNKTKEILESTLYNLNPTVASIILFENIILVGEDSLHKLLIKPTIEQEKPNKKETEELANNNQNDLSQKLQAKQQQQENQILEEIQNNLSDRLEQSNSADKSGVRSNNTLVSNIQNIVERGIAKPRGGDYTINSEQSENLLVTNKYQDLVANTMARYLSKFISNTDKDTETSGEAIKPPPIDEELDIKEHYNSVINDFNHIKSINSRFIHGSFVAYERIFEGELPGYASILEDVSSSDIIQKKAKEVLQQWDVINDQSFKEKYKKFAESFAMHDKSIERFKEMLSNIATGDISTDINSVPKNSDINYAMFTSKSYNRLPIFLLEVDNADCVELGISMLAFRYPIRELYLAKKITSGIFDFDKAAELIERQIEFHTDTFTAEKDFCITRILDYFLRCCNENLVKNKNTELSIKLIDYIINHQYIKSHGINVDIADALAAISLSLVKLQTDNSFINQKIIELLESYLTPSIAKPFKFIESNNKPSDDPFAKLPEELVKQLSKIDEINHIKNKIKPSTVIREVFSHDDGDFVPENVVMNLPVFRDMQEHKIKPENILVLGLPALVQEWSPIKISGLIYHKSSGKIIDTNDLLKIGINTRKYLSEKLSLGKNDITQDDIWLINRTKERMKQCSEQYAKSYPDALTRDKIISDNFISIPPKAITKAFFQTFLDSIGGEATFVAVAADKKSGGTFKVRSTDDLEKLCQNCVKKSEGRIGTPFAGLYLYPNNPNSAELEPEIVPNILKVDASNTAVFTTTDLDIAMGEFVKSLLGETSETDEIKE